MLYFALFLHNALVCIYIEGVPMDVLEMARLLNDAFNSRTPNNDGTARLGGWSGVDPEIRSHMTREEMIEKARGFQQLREAAQWAQMGRLAGVWGVATAFVGAGLWAAREVYRDMTTPSLFQPYVQDWSMDPVRLIQGSLKGDSEQPAVPAGSAGSGGSGVRWRRKLGHRGVLYGTAFS